MNAPLAMVFIPGKPVPQGSAKAFSVGGRARVTHSNGATLNPWRADIHAAVRNLIGYTIAFPTGPVAVGLSFIMPRRKAEPKRITPPHTRKPDLDKLSRSAIDALIGLVFTDDSQVVRIDAYKRTAAIGEQPGLIVEWWSE